MSQHNTDTAVGNCIHHGRKIYMMRTLARSHRTWISYVFSVGGNVTPCYVSVTHLLLQWLQARRA
jgi:hypothetical protein